MNDHRFEVPYRLDSIKAVENAMNGNLLGLEKHYKQMLFIARNLTLEKPDALLKAKTFVNKDFLTVKKEVVRVTRTTREEFASLNFVGQFQLIKQTLPWIVDIACQKDIFLFLKRHYSDARDMISVRNKQLSPIQLEYEAVLTIRRLIKRDILHCVRTGRPKELDRDQLKQAIVCYVLLDPKHADILEALRNSIKEKREALFQNALAELLFKRIPTTITELTTLHPISIRKKLFAKLESLQLRPIQRTQLHGYFPSHTSREELLTVLLKLTTIIKKTTMSNDNKTRLVDYLLSLQKNIEKGSMVYHDLFLSRDLQVMRTLHKSMPFVRMVVDYEKQIIENCAQKNALYLYPTKDYFDLCKGVISNDCISLHDSKNQLKIKNHFNIRVFTTKKWIGNIYMLDFTREAGILLLDRIQLPRSMKINFNELFSNLKDMLEDLFYDVPYNFLLAPLAISNNSDIQKRYNTFRKKLPSKSIQLQMQYNGLFESLSKNGSYYVMLKK